jgi:hypothetical protein
VKAPSSHTAVRTVPYTAIQESSKDIASFTPCFINALSLVRGFFSCSQMILRSFLLIQPSKSRLYFRVFLCLFFSLRFSIPYHQALTVDIFELTVDSILRASRRQSRVKRRCSVVWAIETKLASNWEGTR